MEALLEIGQAKADAILKADIEKGIMDMLRVTLLGLPMCLLTLFGFVMIFIAMALILAGASLILLTVLKKANRMIDAILREIFTFGGSGRA